MIEQLLSERRSFEAVRDQIAALLRAELANQVTLAVADSTETGPYEVSVFVSRARSLNDYLAAPTDGTQRPVVNVWFDTLKVDRGVGSSRSHCTATYQVDAYAYGCATETEGGHSAGDEAAAIEAERVVGLCWSILGHGRNQLLGFPLQSQISDGSEQLIQSRSVTGLEAFQPVNADGNALQDCAGARLTLEVKMFERCHEAESVPLETMSLTLLAEDGTTPLAETTVFEP